MSDAVEVDVAVVTDAGARMLRSAEVLRQQATEAARLEFGGAQAGRDYAAKGDALRDALGVAGVCFEQWAADTESFGHAFQAAAARYTRTDADVAASLTGVQW